MKLELKKLLGSFFGITITFILISIWKNEFVWTELIFMLFGSLIGISVMSYLSKKK